MADNMQQAATLLRQYEDFAKKQRGIDVKADSIEPTESTRKPNRLSGTWSYTNIYDKLINDISGDKKQRKMIFYQIQVKYKFVGKLN